MDVNNTVTTIIGFVLFAISEIVGLLPIRTNGIIHTLAIGIKDSLTTTNNQNTDIEIAQKLVKYKPEMANIINSLEGNPRLIDTVNSITNNPQIIQDIEGLISNNSLRYINTLLINNPEIINDVKKTILAQLVQSNGINEMN
jgi:hypothetical protein